MEIVIKANNEVDSKVFFKRCDLFGARGVAPLMAIRTNAWLSCCYSKATSIFDIQSSIDAVADHVLCFGKNMKFQISD